MGSQARIPGVGSDRSVTNGRGDVSADRLSSNTPLISAKDRLIVALDVPTPHDAIHLVKSLHNVSFFKIGLPLLIQGNILGLIEQIQGARQGDGGIFIDLKTGGDIGSTMGRLIEASMALKIKFLTLIDAKEPFLTQKVIASGNEVKDRVGSEWPKFIVVSVFSNIHAPPETLRNAASIMMDAGADGIVVSGKEGIAACRQGLPHAVIVSPGIRPHGFSHDDHVRFCTPEEAIRAGSDYIIVGRPIIHANNPSDIADTVIDDIDKAMTSAAST